MRSKHSLLLAFLLFSASALVTPALQASLKKARSLDTSPEKLADISRKGSPIAKYWTAMNPALPDDAFEELVYASEVWQMRGAVMTTRTPRDRVREIIEADFNGKNPEKRNLPLKYAAVRFHDTLKKIAEEKGNVEIAFLCLWSFHRKVELWIQPYREDESGEKWHALGDRITLYSKGPITEENFHDTDAISLKEVVWRVRSQIDSDDRSGPRTIAAKGGKTKKRKPIPLHAAVLDQDIPETKSLLESRSDVNQLNHRKVSALHLATYLGNADLIRMLMDFGADPNLADTTGYTSLIYAAESGCLPCVNQLLEANAELDRVQVIGKSALVSAVESGHFEIADRIVEAGASMDTADFLGRTLLHYLAEKGTPEQIEKFLSRGADPKVADLDGLTPFHRAILNESTAVFDILRRDDYDFIEHESQSGDTALLLALEFGKKKSALYLLDNGANPSVVNSSGYPPLFLAAKTGMSDVVEKLVQQGADPNWMHETGETSLGIAAANAHREACRALIENGAEIVDTDATVEEVSARGFARMVAADAVVASDSDRARELYELAVQDFGEAATGFRSTMLEFNKKRKGKVFRRKLVEGLLIAASHTLAQMQANMQAQQWAQITALNQANSHHQYFAIYNRELARERLIMYSVPDYKTPENTTKIEELALGYEIYKSRLETAEKYLAEARSKIPKLSSAQ